MAIEVKKTVMKVRIPEKHSENMEKRGEKEPKKKNDEQYLEEWIDLWRALE